MKRNSKKIKERTGIFQDQIHPRGVHLGTHIIQRRHSSFHFSPHLPQQWCHPLELCKNLINDPNPAVVLTPQIGGSRSFLRFHLCTVDMERLLLPDMADMLPENATTILSNYLQNNTAHIPRKKYALLGQALLHKFACIQLFGFMAVLNPIAYAPLNGWRDLERLRAHVDANSDLLPAKFNDLEDEDHVGDAVDDEECCSVLDMECIDGNSREIYD